MQTIEINTDEIKDLSTGAMNLVTASKGVAIKNDSGLRLAVDTLRRITETIKALNEKRFAITRPIDASKKLVMDLFEVPLATLTLAVLEYKREILRYESEMEEVRAKQQALADAKALAEEEAQKNKMLDKAEAAFATGDIATAEKFVEQAETHHVAAPNMSTANRKGTSIPVTWKYRILDENAIPDEYWVLDEKKLAGVVRAMKDKTTIPGIQAFGEKNLTVR